MFKHIILACEATEMITKNSFLELNTNAKIARVQCRYNTVPSPTCNILSGISPQNPGLGFHASAVNYASISITFASATTTTWTFTRWNSWDQSCRVDLLHNGNIVGWVPPNEGENTGHKTTVTVNVNAGETVELFEGYDPYSGSSDGQPCGAIVYNIAVCDFGMVV